MARRFTVNCELKADSLPVITSLLNVLEVSTTVLEGKAALNPVALQTVFLLK